MHSQPKLLIIDDEEDVRAIVAMALRSSYTVIEAENGSLGVQLAREEQPSVILLDVLMRDSDGPAVLAELRADDAMREVPVIFLTGVENADELERLVALGARGVIQKPIDLRTFADDIESIVGGGAAANRVGRDEVELDAEVLEQLRSLSSDDDPLFAEDLVDAFLADVPPRLDIIEAALRRGDAQAAAREAHALKSSCGNVGATEMSRIAASIERADRNVARREALAQVDALRRAFAATTRALHRWLAS